MTEIVRNKLAKLGPGGQPLPFAKSVVANGFVFVSGQMGIVEGSVVTGGIIAQTEQAIANLRKVLQQSGCDLADVVKINAWLDDARDFWDFNGVFAQHFGEHPPARSTVVSPLVLDAKVEIDAIACQPEK